MGPRAIVGIQALEQRVLLSADGEAPHEVEWIQWQGQQIEVVKNELIVGLEPKGYMINWLDNWVIDSALCRAPKTGPEPWLIEALAEVAPQVRFVTYGAYEHRFKVEIQDGADYQAAADALAALPRFRYVDPNVIFYAYLAPADPVVNTHTALEGAEVRSDAAARSSGQTAVAPNPNVSRAHAAPASRVLDAVFADSVETNTSLM
jgi:hypothetical protein